MMLEVNPTELLISNDPLFKMQSEILTLCNPTAGNFCFKIKSTSPNRLQISPNIGYISAQVKI